MKDNTIYDDDSIQSLDPRRHVQLRAGMYIGSTETPTQLLIEIFSNALDEHNLGHGNRINVLVCPDGSCTIEDFGQGFPVNVEREDGKTILQASFDEMNTSGKYSDDGVYGGTSLGLNGVGSKATTFLSTYLIVTSYRTQDKKYEKIVFQDGVFQKRQVGKWTKPYSGTKVEFKPNPQFFESPKFDTGYLKKLFDDITCLCPELIITYEDKDGTVDFHHPSGISDIVELYATDNQYDLLTDDILSFQKTEGDYSLVCGLGYVDTHSSNIIAYVNYGLTEQGPHITSLKSTLTRAMNKWAREQGILSEKDKNIDGDSLQEGLVLAFNLVAPGISYDAQTKGKVVSKEFVPFLTKVFSEQLEIWLDNNPEYGKNIIEKALLARRAAEAAKKAREAVRNKKSKKKQNKILHPDKLKDAERLGQESSLVIVEGLSAGSSVAVARDVKKYGILMLRGKLINAFTQKEERLLKNEEIQLLLQALNITPHEYDSSDLRYGRVLICTDSDSDGFNIGLLITVALQHFAPEFIKEGRLGWLRSPLYILKTKKGEEYFYTDSELAAKREQGKLVGELQRNKGLGSLSAEQSKESMFGKRQHIDMLEPDKGFDVLLDKLMGKDTSARKQYIFDNIDFSEVKE